MKFHQIILAWVPMSENNLSVTKDKVPRDKKQTLREVYIHSVGSTVRRDTGLVLGKGQL